ncbi:MAG: dipeptide epimerase [Haloarculaceae archaeon]
MTLRADVAVHELPLGEAFTISRGSQETAEVVVVELDDGERVGVGAAAPSAYYGESVDSVRAALPDLLDAAEAVGDPHEVQRIERQLQERAPDDAAARTAVDIALWDLHARRLDTPLYRLFGLDADATPRTSYTISIGDLDGMRQRTEAAVEEGYEVLKVKLGTEHDREVVETVRAAAPDATVRVDANCAWDVDTALAMTDVLAANDVEFVEQPVAADDVAGLRRVRVEGAVPVAADESCVTAADVPRVADAVDIVVCKLLKCGGVGPAIKQIQTAHANGLQVMLGCMVTSDAAISAAAHLSPLVEYADVDGALLLAEDVYEGVPMPEGRIDLRAVDRPGTGVRRVDRE